MKFGKHIRTVAYPPWADSYVDYKGLKKLLKPLENGQGTVEEEAGFVAALYAEIDKVDTFFTAKESEFHAEFRLFCIQVNETKVECCRQRCATLEEVVEAYEGTAAGTVIQSFIDYTHKLETLRKYVMINVLAIIKITKKHDKHSRSTIQADLVQAVHNRHLYCSERFGTLITDVEVLAMHLMSRLADQRVSPDTLLCPSCAQVLCNPIVLPCGHRFCMRCVSAASFFKAGYRCPVCRQQHTLDLDTLRYGSMLSPSPASHMPNGLDWRTHSHSASAAPATVDSKQGECQPDTEATLDPAEKDSINRRAMASGPHLGPAAAITAAIPTAGAVTVVCTGPAQRTGPSGARRCRNLTKGDEAERVIEESLMRASDMPDLAESALSMSPDGGGGGVSLLQRSHDADAGSRLPAAGISVRGGAGGALVVSEVVSAGPAARCGAVRRGDVLVAVDPGGDYASRHWQYEDSGNRRWIDVRGWPPAQLPALVQGPSGSPLWLRLRRAEREVVAHVVRGGGAPAAMFEPARPDVVLVAADGVQVTLPYDLAVEIRPVREALEPESGPRKYASPVPRSPAGPAAGRLDGGVTRSPVRPTSGCASGGSGGSRQGQVTGRVERSRCGVGGKLVAEGDEDSESGSAVSFQVVDPSGLCSAGNIRALLARIDPGFASSLAADPSAILPGTRTASDAPGRRSVGIGAGCEPWVGDGEIDEAMVELLRTADPRVAARRLEREVLTAQAELAATDAALAAAERHLAPAAATAAPELTAHPKLAVAVGHVRVAVEQLRHDRRALTHRLSQPDAVATARRLARARARAGWRARPSVVSWSAPPAAAQCLLGCEPDATTIAELRAADAARARVLEALGRVCVLLRVAAALPAPRASRALMREVADSLAQCEDSEQLLAAVGVDSDALRPDEAAEAAAVLDLAAAGAPESASGLAAALSRAAVRRVGGASPLHQIGDGLLATLVRELDDSGWRYISVTVALPAGGELRGLDECTMVMHVQSRALLQLRHRTRRAAVVFRPGPGAEVLRCDCGGAIEPGSLAAPDAVRDLDAAVQAYAGGAGGGAREGRVRRVPAGGLGQVGEWRTCVQRGRLVWTNGGTALHLTRAGGFVFLPGRDNASAVVLQQGWVRAVPRYDAVARLSYSV